MRAKAHIVLFLCLIALTANAQDNSDAAADATNPLAFVTKLQMQPNFTWKEDDARQINLTSRIIHDLPAGSSPYQPDIPRKSWTQWHWPG